MQQLKYLKYYGFLHDQTPLWKSRQQYHGNAIGMLRQINNSIKREKPLKSLLIALQLGDKT